VSEELGVTEPDDKSSNPKEKSPSVWIEVKGLCGLFQTFNSKKMKEITFCVDCQKPLYVTENIKLFGFDTRKFCRNNCHFDVEVKIVAVAKLHSA